eukprot:2938480-Pyramimonas_sp.AAC.1
MAPEEKRRVLSPWALAAARPPSGNNVFRPVRETAAALRKALCTARAVTSSECHSGEALCKAHFGSRSHPPICLSLSTPSGGSPDGRCKVRPAISARFHDTRPQCS